MTHIKLNENERTALEFFCKYDSEKPENIIKDAIHDKLEWYVKAISNDVKDGIFREWLRNGKEIEG